MAPKNSLRDKLEDDNLDLSLMQLSEVPVDEIAAIPKATKLDLSNNMLTHLPENFPTLTQLVKLDLSKNRLIELPEYFGQLKNLKHLDLYSNELKELPVSFANLKLLKWLDLKNNPLAPTLQQAAGPCITKDDCAKCAKKVVALLQSKQSQLERERQKKILAERKAEEARKAEEEAERERIRAEKRAAKEKRREEAARQAKAAKNDGSDDTQHEMEKPRDSKQQNGNVENKGSSGRRSGCCWSLFMFLLGLVFVAVASGFSMLWIYTGGKLDQKSIDRALPVIRNDVDYALGNIGKKAEGFYTDSSKTLRPYVENFQVKASEAWVELGRRQKVAAQWLNQNVGPYCCSALKSCKELLLLAQEKFIQFWDWLRPLLWEQWQWIKPKLQEAWASARPVLQNIGDYILKQTQVIWEWLVANVPIYYNIIATKVSEFSTQVSKSVSSYING